MGTLLPTIIFDLPGIILSLGFLWYTWYWYTYTWVVYISASCDGTRGWGWRLVAFSWSTLVNWYLLLGTGYQIEYNPKSGGIIFKCQAADTRVGRVSREVLSHSLVLLGTWPGTLSTLASESQIYARVTSAPWRLPTLSTEPPGHCRPWCRCLSWVLVDGCACSNGGLTLVSRPGVPLVVKGDYTCLSAWVESA